jgi:hypothetical protein
MKADVGPGGKPFAAYPAYAAVVHDHANSLIIKELKKRFAH